MAKIPGTAVASPIVPSDDRSTRATHQAQYGKGGLRRVATVAALNDIPSERREYGMLVFVDAVQSFYQCGPSPAYAFGAAPFVPGPATGTIYATTTAGLAAVSEGEYFYVADSTSLTLYRDLSGVATEIGEFPTLATLGAQVSAASASAVAALASENKAEEWAENPEDDPVETGQYSALHHAAKAADSAAAASASQTAAASSATSASASATSASNDAAQAGVYRDQARAAADATPVDHIAYTYNTTAPTAVSIAASAPDGATIMILADESAEGDGYRTIREVDSLAVNNIDPTPLLIFEGDAIRSDLASTASGKGAGLVSLSQGGTVQDLLHYITPETEGAVGDASADASLAFQNVLSALKSDNYNSMVVPPRNYLLSTKRGIKGVIETPQASRYGLDFGDASLSTAINDVFLYLNKDGDLASLDATLSRHVNVRGGHFLHTNEAATASVGIRGVSLRNLTLRDIELEDFNTGISISGRDTYYLERIFIRRGAVGVHFPDDITDPADNNLMINIAGLHCSNPDLGIWVENKFGDLFVSRSSFNFASASNKTGILIESLVNGVADISSNFCLDRLHFDPALDDSVGIHVKGRTGSPISNGTIENVLSSFNGHRNVFIKLEWVRLCKIDAVDFGNTLYSEDQTFAAAAVNTSTDAINITAHGLVTGDIISFSTTGALPTGLDARFYTAIRVDDNNFKVARSYTDANAGTAVDITAQGSGTHTVAHHSSIPIQIDENCQNITIGSANAFTTGPIDYRCARNQIIFGKEMVVNTYKTLTGYYGDSFSSGSATLDMYALLGTTLPNHRSSLTASSRIPGNIPPRGYTVHLGCSGSASAANAVQVNIGPSAARDRNNTLSVVTTNDPDNSLRFNTGFVEANQNGDLVIEYTAISGTITLYATVLAIHY